MGMGRDALETNQEFSIGKFYDVRCVDAVGRRFYDSTCTHRHSIISTEWIVRDS